MGSFYKTTNKNSAGKHGEPCARKNSPWPPLVRQAHQSWALLWVTSVAHTSCPLTHLIRHSFSSPPWTPIIQNALHCCCDIILNDLRHLFESANLTRCNYRSAFCSIVRAFVVRIFISFCLKFGACQQGTSADTQKRFPQHPQKSVLRTVSALFRLLKFSAAVSRLSASVQC